MRTMMEYRSQARFGLRRCVAVSFFALSALLGALTNAKGQAIYWIPGYPGGISPSSMSSSATYVAGYAYDNNTNQWVAARWSARDGIQLLPTLAGYGSNAHAISANGNAVVGDSLDNQGRQRPFRWVEGTGIRDLGTLGGDWGAAMGVSADGEVVVGVAQTAPAYEDNIPSYNRAFRWTSQTGMQDLGALDGGDSIAHGVSADGSVVVGTSDTQQGQRAFRWMAQTGMQDLGTGFNGGQGQANAVSADGNIIVGASFDRAFRWTPSTGMQNLSLLYASLLSFGDRLERASAISPDGRFIVGMGYNGATSRYEAFLLDTGSPRRGDVNRDGCVDDADLLAVLFAFGSAGYNNADLNWNGIVDDADLLFVLFNFGDGC